MIFYGQLSTTFQNAIVTSTVPNTYGYGIPSKTDGGAYTTNDKIFIPSHNELAVLGSYSSDFRSSGVQLQGLSTEAGQRIKVLGTSATNYWTRSAHTGNSYLTGVINLNGDIDNSIASYNNGVVPMLSIADKTLVKQVSTNTYELVMNSNPTINVTSVYNQTVSNLISLTGSVNDADVGDVLSIKYRIDSGSAQSVVGTVTTSGTFTNTSIDTSILAVGTHTLNVWAEDNKGGIGEITTKNFTKIAEYYYTKYNMQMLWNDSGTGAYYGGTTTANPLIGYKNNYDFDKVTNKYSSNAYPTTSVNWSIGAVAYGAGVAGDNASMYVGISTPNVWHIYMKIATRNTQSLQKGSVNQSNIKAVDGTYPNNGLHSDGYWYIKGSIVNDNPNITVTAPINGITNPDYLSLTGSVIDNNIGDKITVKYNIDGTVTQTVVGTVTTSGNFTPTTLDMSLLSYGTHTLNVWAIDNTGKQSNITTISFNKIIDTSNPKIDSVTLTSTDKTIKVNITASDEKLTTESYIYSIDGQASASTANTNYTFSGLTANKKYTIEVKVLDAAGNTATHSEEIYTKAQTPSINGATVLENKLKLNIIDENAKTTLYLIMCNNKYINALGQVSTVPVWMTLPEKSIILDGLDLNTQYTFKVKAKPKLGQETAFSETITAKIGVDSLLEAQDSNNYFQILSKTGREVQFSWHAPIDPTQIKKYELYRDGKLIKTTKNTAFTDHGLDYATTYIYKIKAYDSSNNVFEFSEPLNVTTSDVEEVSKLATGEFHNLMLKSDGTVWAWGSNEYGQRGIGTSGIDTNSSNAKKVKGLDHIINIFAGDSHSLALKSDGTVWAWGANEDGQLGNGNFENQHEPVQVKDIYDVISISAGNAHTMYLTSDGFVWGSGYNEFGQLGDGTNTSRKSPVKVLEIKDIKSISTGDYHTLAVKQDGKVLAWGANWSGQLGDSTSVNKNTPVQVSDLDNIVKLQGGQEHSLALKEDGTVWAWGYNEHGTLGDGTTTDRLEPVQVVELENIIDLDAGNYHNIALRNDKTVWTWGINMYGVLGDGTWNISTTPVQNISLSDVEQITAGGWHNMVITSDQNIWSWGRWEYGQLGNDNNWHTTIPEMLEGFIMRTVFGSLEEVVSDTSLMINWSGGADTATYELELNNTIITSTERNYIQVDGLKPKTDYTYRIRQVNSMGITTDWSEPRSITTYALPTPYAHEGLVDETSIEIKWDPVQDATGYEIDVDGQVISVASVTPDTSGTTTPPPTTPPTSTTPTATTPTTTLTPMLYKHLNLEQNTTHKYKVRAIGTDGNSSWSEEVPVTTLPVRPESPTDLKGFATDTVIKLDWTAILGVIGYDLELDGITIENGIETTYDHTGLDPFTQHKYRIRSRSDLIEGNWSNTLTVFTLPGKPKAPEKITVSTVGKVSTLNWEVKTGSLRYEIEVDGTIYNAGNNTTYIHRGITLGQEHLYRIRSVNKIGTSDWSGYIVNNSIKAISTKKKDLELGLTASNITDFSQYELSVFYNKDVLKVKDLCAKTSVFELSPGFIEQEGITIKSFEPGKITFTVSKEIELGYDWTGIVNNIIFDGQVSGGTTIDYTVYIIPQ